MKYSELERQYSQPVIVMAPRVVQAPINAKKARPGPRYRKASELSMKGMMNTENKASGARKTGSLR